MDLHTHTYTYAPLFYGCRQVLGYLAGAREKNDLQRCLLEIVTRLVDSGILKNWPNQISVNHYDGVLHDYEMVPHKDGFADQAAILSLGSDTVLEFWVSLYAHVCLWCQQSIITKFRF